MSPAMRYRPLWGAFLPWQGMQYLRDQFSGRAKLSPLDTARYPDLHWTGVAAMLARRLAGRSGLR